MIRWMNSLFNAGFRAPLLVIALGGIAAVLMRIAGVSVISADGFALAGQLGLGLIAFSAGTQFRVSRLAKDCPVSFRLGFGGAPLFLIISGLAAFILIPQVALAPAFLLGGILMLNGSTFDRRAITNAPAPSLIKAGVRLESAVILSLGLPVVMLLEANATAAAPGHGMLFPLLDASRSAVIAFGFGGSLGLLAAIAGNRWFMNYGVGLSVIMVIVAMVLSPVLGAHPVVAASALGLIWGEQSRAGFVSRLRLRARLDRTVLPIGFFLFGLALSPRLLEADLLGLTFALAAVTVMRAGPRLVALQRSVLPREGQMFMAWFGGTPGLASALYLLTLMSNGHLDDHELVLSLGTLCVLAGVITARVTSQPLVRHYVRALGLARRRQMFGA